MVIILSCLLIAVSIALVISRVNARVDEKLVQETVGQIHEFIKTTTDFMTSCNKLIKLLHQLNEVLLMGRDPGVHMLYNKLKEHGPVDSPELAAKMSNEVSSEVFTMFTKKINELLSKTEDPIKRERFSEILKEMSTVHALYLTLSPDSSRDYVETVGRNIFDMTKKVSAMFRTLAEDGMLDDWNGPHEA